MKKLILLIMISIFVLSGCISESERNEQIIEEQKKEIKQLSISINDEVQEEKMK